MIAPMSGGREGSGQEPGVGPDAVMAPFGSSLCCLWFYSSSQHLPRACAYRESWWAGMSNLSGRSWCLYAHSTPLLFAQVLVPHSSSSMWTVDNALWSSCRLQWNGSRFFFCKALLNGISGAAYVASYNKSYLWGTEWISLMHSS